jgi:hypothetical protein
MPARASLDAAIVLCGNFYKDPLLAQANQIGGFFSVYISLVFIHSGISLKVILAIISRALLISFHADIKGADGSSCTAGTVLK